MEINYTVDEKIIEPILKEQTLNFIKRFLSSYDLPKEVKDEIIPVLQYRVKQTITAYAESEEFAEAVKKKFGHILVNSMVDKELTDLFKKD